MSHDDHDHHPWNRLPDREAQPMRAAWARLELEPPPALDAGFREQVLAAARQLTAADGWGWSSAPGWARAGGVAALVLGLILGMGAGRLDLTAPSRESVGGAVLAEPVSLAETYWLDLAELDGDTGDTGDTTP